jgi:2-haloacid dehalogenase
MIDLSQYKAITFDCYGTLIDWETGILTAFQPIVINHHLNLDEDTILQYFAEFESVLEQGEYINYREVLKGVVQKFGEKCAFNPTEIEINALANSIQYWQPFTDTVAALKLLKQRFRLVIISNIDDDLFAFSANKLEVVFDHIITAQQVKTYKPSLNNFREAIQKIGLPKEEILHIAASVYHDIIPAKSLGLSTIWVNRRAGKQGSGATLPSTGKPDLVVPDLQSLLGYL